MRNPFARRPAPARIEPRLSTARLETRDAAGFGLGTFVGGLTTTDGVSGTFAENLSAVVACVGAISSALASLPIRSFRNTPGGRVELPVGSHWLPDLLANPSEQMTWPELCEFLVASAVLHGNGLATIRYDDDGTPVELVPAPWEYCTPVLLNSGKLAFNVNMTFAPYFGAGVFKTFRATETVYLKDRTNNGWIGVSRLARSPSVIAAAMGVQTFSASVWTNSANPSGILSHPGRLNSEARAYLAEKFKEAHSGPHLAKTTVVLDEGLTWTPVSTTPADAETLETRKFTVAEICRVYQVPPQIVQSNEESSFSSAETAQKWFAQNSLAPWAKKLEAALGKALLSDEPDLHVEIDFSQLLRGDFAARWASYATAAQNKILSIDEIRNQESFGPMRDAAAEVAAGSEP